MDSAPLTWQETRRRLAEDRARIRSMLGNRYRQPPRVLLLDPCYQAALLHRVSHYFWRRGSGKLGRLVGQLNTLVTGVDINPQSDLQGGLWIPHPTGASIAGHAGRNFTLGPIAGVGMTPDVRDVGAGPGQPVIGDDVVLAAWSGVLGPVRIGNGVWLHPACAAFRDFPDRAEVRHAFEPEPNAEPWAKPSLRSSHATCEHRRLRVSWQDYRSDVRQYIERLPPYRGRSGGRLRWIGAFTSTQIFATGLYRLSHWLHMRGWCFGALVVFWTNLLLNKVTITPQSCIGPRLFLPHPVGMVIHGRLQSGTTFYARTLCTSHSSALMSSLDHAPMVGRDVTFTGHSAVLGPVDVGDNVRVGSGVTLSQDAPSDVAVASAIARARFTTRGPKEISDVRCHPSSATRLDSQHSPITWRETRRRLRADRQRLQALQKSSTGLFGLSLNLACFFPSYVCVWLSRVAHYWFTRGHERLARGVWHLNLLLTGGDIAPWSDLGGGLFLPHPAGVSIHATAGENLTVMALSTIGPGIQEYAHSGTNPVPILGHNVFVGHLCGIHGDITVGDDVHLVDGTYVSQDAPTGSTLRPPRIRLQRFARARTSSATGSIA